MTRKDYILIADILVEQHKNLLAPRTLLPALVDPATKILAASSASFDIQKFRNYILKKLK